jgi:hypothetical protein
MSETVEVDQRVATAREFMEVQLHIGGLVEAACPPAACPPAACCPSAALAERPIDLGPWRLKDPERTLL